MSGLKVYSTSVTGSREVNQVAAERGDAGPGREAHQVRAGGHLAGQRAAGGDAGQGGRPQGHPAPDRQRGPVLRGLRGLRGSGGAEHPAAVPEAGLSPRPPPPPSPSARPRDPAKRRCFGCAWAPRSFWCLPEAGRRARPQGPGQPVTSCVLAQPQRARADARLPPASLPFIPPAQPGCPWAASPPCRRTAHS